MNVEPAEALDEAIEVFDPDPESTESANLTEYDLVSTPNDFNVLTIKSFLESGAVKIPRYQRNYVWDRARASKLIESLILGLPVPQVFLYEEARNSFQIIDGQQRLMTIYFFMVGRFPRRAVRPMLRHYWGEKGAIPTEILFDDQYFENFKLQLKSADDGNPNPLHGENYETLGERQTQLSMRTIRNVIIKQVSPSGRGAVYEIFNRLNTTGVNLSAQEIRVSLAASPYMDRLFDLNERATWRAVLGTGVQDPRLRDLEILFRALAMANHPGEYRPSMVRFLNEYADRTKQNTPTETDSQFSLLEQFLDGVAAIGREPLLVSGRLSVPMFEAAFAGYATAAAELGEPPNLTLDSLVGLTSDGGFVATSSDKTTDKRNVDQRIRIATRHFVASR
jgi:hypothetical protein